MADYLDQYETVKSRKTRFYADHPDGRIVVEPMDSDWSERAIVHAKVYLNREDQIQGLPRGSGMALELRDHELSQSNSGKKYESVNYSSWLENAEESAVGRALDNAGYASNGKCSRDEIEKSKRNADAIKAKAFRQAIPPSGTNPVNDNNNNNNLFI